MFSRRLRTHTNIHFVLVFLVEFSINAELRIKESPQIFRVNYLEDIELDFEYKMVYFKHFIPQLENVKVDKAVTALRSYKLILVPFRV